MSLPPRRDVRRHFWSLILAGSLRAEAAVAVGVKETTGKRWFRQAGGVAPSDVHVQPSGRYLSLAEREEILRRRRACPVHQRHRQGHRALAVDRSS